ncbi:Transmembrane protein 41B [Haplosporangium gracile]|nr:Transmembrane protein 41B [Haplosporangium gracile]
MADDRTPLLGNVASSNSNATSTHNKDSKRERLLNMTPRQSFLLLLALIITTFTCVYFLVKYTLPKDIPEDQREWLKFPRSAKDVQHLSILLEGYLQQHYYQVLFVFMTLYISVQAFAIPGSVMLSVLGGALFKLWRGIFIVLFCASFGSLCCYTISWYVCHPIVEKYLTKRIQQLSVKIEAKRDELFFYFAFLRVTPFIPNWFMNIASPHLGISATIFYFGTLIGVLPNTLVTVQAGVTLAALASPDDFTLLTPQNIIMTIVICICLLIPIILHNNSEDPTADAPKPATEDGLAQV